MKQEKILVAGVAGFLGAYLAESLIESGMHVVGIDNWTTGFKKNIDHLLGNPQFDFIECNINQQLPESFFKEEWYAIVHIANVEAFSHPQRLELQELLTNSFGVKNLLDLALKTKSRFVLTSSIDIYHGLASHTDLTSYYENVQQHSMLTLSEAKRYAEALCQEYVSLYGVDVRIARLSEVYGPKMNLESDSVIAQIVRASIQGENLILDDVGSRTMYATFYTDVVYGLNKLILSDKDKLRGGIFYLVNKEPISLLSIVLTVKEYSQHDVSVEFLPKVKDPLFSTPVVDVSRSRNELYWNAKVPLQEGMKKTMVYYASNKQVQADTKTDDSLQAVSQEQEEANETAKKKDKNEHETKIIETAAAVTVLSQATERPKEEVVIEQEVNHEEIEQLDESNGEKEQSQGWLALKDSPAQAPTQPSKKEEKNSSSQRSSNRSKLRLIPKIAMATLVFIAIWFIAIPIGGLLIHGTIAALQVNGVKNAYASSDFAQAEERMSSLSRTVEQLGYYWERTGWFWSGAQQQDVYVSGQLWLQLGAEVTKAGEYGTAFLETTQPWWKPLTLGSDDALFAEQRTQERLALSQSEWRLFRQHIGVSRQLTDNSNLVSNTVLYSQQLQGVDLVRQLYEVTNVDETTWQHLPQWFGYEEPQTIILLLQNNAEIRATGGFIGSYALATVDTGTITSLQVNDIYNPDGQLEDLITEEDFPPPAPIKENLADGPLMLRDSNWWPDFPKSAGTFSELFVVATGVSPDWVVGLNLSTIESLLSVVGPVTLPDTGEAISAEELFEKAQTASERDFEPGSTGKRDFIGQVTQQLWLSLFPMDEATLGSITKVLGQQVGTGQIMLYASDAESEAAIAESSASGEVKDMIGDYISVISSNVGNNKANNWVERSTQYSVFVDRDSSMRARLTVHFEHSGTSETWPNGPYKDYLRVYLPNGIELNDAKGFTGDVTTYTENGKMVIAGIVNVDLDSEKDVVLTYALPSRVSFSETDTYDVFVQGQAGIIDETFMFDMQLPFFLDTTKMSPGVTVDGEKVVHWNKTLRNYNQLSISVSQQQ